MIHITVLFFATLKDRAGTNRQMIELPAEATVADLKSKLADQFPAIKPLLNATLVSVDQNFAFDEDRIPDGSEVALFPPVSGGSYPTILEIVQEPLDHDELLKQIKLPTTGAICVFSGIVRGETMRGDPHQTISLEYDAYVPMAKAKMAQVAAEIRQRWPAIEGIVIVQRIGLLEAGTPTVVIACAAAHRNTGVFEAARYGIDRLKEIVPIWKKEITPDGEEWIEGEYHPQRGE
ncbi:MAG TPA: molybdenum cofactor biosynthesis protein MoaE [Anaerolineaceae bacterium]|nr:molybdenum cofactor biosynthesis protein MoaE [Anaerolineaceae bacterium]